MNPAREAFITELKDLRARCGSPSYRVLATTSEEVTALYEGRDLPTLSTTAIYEILAGQRAELPGSAWVTSFVLSCQRHAWKICLFADDPGLRAVPAWQEKLQAARATMEGSPPEVMPPDPGVTPLARAEHDHVASQGPFGRTLLAALRAGDPDAAYQVAVVLAAAPSHRDAAVALLLRPGTARHLLALELLEAEDGRFEEAVADHACALGRAAAADGRTEAAVVFFTCAARCRSFTGVVELAATLLADRGDTTAAAQVRAANGTGGEVRPMTPHGADDIPL